MTVKFITSKEAAEIIKDGSTIAVGGFIGTGVAEEIHESIGQYFKETGHPRNLTLIYAAGIGDGKDRGLNHYAQKGLLKRVIGGHWGLAPMLQPQVAANEIEAYNFPQGVLSQMFRDIASHKPFHISRVGLGTFVDPDFQGGKLNKITTEDLVEKKNFDGKDYLVYKLVKPDFAILRGTYADENGNISFEDEPLTLESTSIAIATHNAGGKVIVQVKNKVSKGSLDPKSIKIPGLLVDYVVEVSDESKHMQTFATQFNSEFVKANVIKESESENIPLNQRKIIARRCALFLNDTDRIVNYGIGMPETISLVLKEEGINEKFTPTVEPGSFGGVPQGGLDFGCSVAPESVIDQCYMFDFYDGGGIDIAFLGLAECDKQGNINVSKFGPKIAGAGGFINITQNTNRVIFCGTFTAGGLKISVEDGKLNIVQEGKSKKFVEAVEQITFSGKTAISNEQTVYYVTERAVFKLTAEGVTLIEYAKGMDIEKDILAHMSFKPHISEDLCEMDARIFKEEKMGLN